jgi:hypothetical protein
LGDWIILVPGFGKYYQKVKYIFSDDFRIFTGG